MRSSARAYLIKTSNHLAVIMIMQKKRPKKVANKTTKSRINSKHLSHPRNLMSLKKLVDYQKKVSSNSATLSLKMTMMSKSSDLRTMNLVSMTNLKK